ncbi:hypothetical protein Bpfe_016158 [Biomphalaria pfeifferi]|uniref:Uncharacterized protein n=1 Tax=Biomphalaria pfeifferi TaxID=112525 RepID=A0AAD8BIV5_BIOPF|nr:hypothetical protein Bpfe_016158 [Biomphalaria pfeifferi]
MKSKALCETQYGFKLKSLLIGSDASQNPPSLPLNPAINEVSKQSLNQLPIDVPFSLVFQERSPGVNFDTVRFKERNQSKFTGSEI